MGTPVARLAAAFGLLAVAACGTGEAAEESVLQTTTAVRGDLRITAEATGTVEPIRKVEVKSKASGEILSLAVDVGDVVETGSRLARVDPRDVRNSYEQAEADLQVARSRLEIAKAQLDRSRELLGSGVITQNEFESANLEHANAQASLVKARTNMELAELRLSDVVITAPMAGTILEKNVEEGQVIQSASQNVSGGTTLFVMANLEAMQVRTLVDETDMGELRPGMPASVQVEAFPDRTFTGLVEKIEPQAVVQQNVTMFPVIVNLDNRNGLLRPGMNAEVEILIDEANGVLLVPNNAVVLPQDAGPAAMALGLDLEDLDLAAMGGRRGGRGAVRGADGGGPRGGGAGPSRAAGGSSAEAGGPAADDDGVTGPGGSRGGGTPAFDSIRALVQSGEITRDSARVLTGAMRQGRSDAPAAGAPPVEAGAGSAARQTRRAVVFVVDSAGVPSPRPVEIGLNDWDNTAVVSGLEEGEQIAVIGAAQLQQQQEEFRRRIRERMGGPFPGGRR